jgi:bacterioferritin (cytochrome b1)
MATLVGTQKNFLDALKELLEFEYDVAEAYETATAKINAENHAYRKKLLEFHQEHNYHITELSNILKSFNEKPLHKPDIVKKFLSNGKIYLANLIGDKKILAAMANNEIDTNLAYERMNARHDISEQFKKFFKQALADEKKHKTWFENSIKHE